MSDFFGSEQASVETCAKLRVAKWKGEGHFTMASLKFEWRGQPGFFSFALSSSGTEKNGSFQVQPNRPSDRCFNGQISPFGASQGWRLLLLLSIKISEYVFTHTHTHACTCVWNHMWPTRFFQNSRESRSGGNDRTEWNHLTVSVFLCVCKADVKNSLA